MAYKRKGSSYIQIRVGGVRRSSGTTDPKAAAALERKLNLDAYKESELGAKPKRSWKELCLQWAKERSHKVSWAEDLRAIKWWTQWFGDVEDVRQITRERVDAIIAKERPVNAQAATPANNTANHYTAILASMLLAATREWDWIERAPKLRKYPVTEGRQRWLTVEEWRKLEAELPDHLKRAATFALATGMRAEKVFSLTWKQIDLKNRSLSFEGTANKLGNTIPLNATAMAVLDACQKARHLTRVFCWLKPKKIGTTLTHTLEPLGSYGLAWFKAQERAGIKEFTWHGLRHTYASWLAQAMVPEGIIDRLGGWSGAGNTRTRYTHLAVEHLRPYAETIDRVLAGQEAAVRVA